MQLRPGVQQWVRGAAIVTPEAAPASKVVPPSGTPEPEGTNDAHKQRRRRQLMLRMSCATSAMIRRATLVDGLAEKILEGRPGPCRLPRTEI